MDGNRRWAKAQSKDPWEGHRAGAHVLKEIVRAGKERDVSNLFFYTLSTENWKRDQTELDFLFALLEEFFLQYIDEVKAENVRVRIAGQRERFSPKLQEIFMKIESETAQATGLTLWLGLSYGGRAEIVEGVNAALKSGESVTEESFKKFLWTADMPDADIIIRTGGEHRLSGFLTWASAYSEIFFVDTLWPAFTREDFFKILDDFTSRDRRMGK